MKCIIDFYLPNEKIPIQDYISNKKLAKYYNREAAAAVICAAKLFNVTPVSPNTPFYYDTGVIEHEDYGLDKIMAASFDKEGNFSQQLFVQKGVKAVMPLTQFKALYNMPLSLVSIEFGLEGDNAVIYASASGLLTQALHAPVEKNILLGSGKIHKDGSVEAAFALVEKEEIRNSPFLNSDLEGIAIFRSWSGQG